MSHCSIKVIYIFLSQSKYWNVKSRSMSQSKVKENAKTAVILLPAYRASFAHHFVSGMQSFYFGESEGAIVLQTCHQKKVFWTYKFVVGLVDMGNSES